MTFLQFFFIALEGFFPLFNLKELRMEERKQPASFYLALTFIFFTLSYVNNWAYDFNISQPLHMVFRSCSLIASFLMGIVFKEKYHLFQGLGVLVVSGGIFLTTYSDFFLTSSLASSSFASSSSCCSSSLPKLNCSLDCNSTASNSLNTTSNVLGKVLGEAVGGGGGEKMRWWYVGILMLLGALILSTLLGHLQQWGYKKWGKCQREAIFYQHFFGLLWFVPSLVSLYRHSIQWYHSPPFHLLGFLHIPELWLFAFFNVFTQWVCVRGVYICVETVGSLTTNLVLTCRKFLSLLVSIWLFNNPWTEWHWYGTILVFLGTFVYTYGEVNNSSEKEKKD